jgi:hypothetical protein
VYLDYTYLSATLFYAKLIAYDLSANSKEVIYPKDGSYPYYVTYGYDNDVVALINYKSGGGGGGMGGLRRESTTRNPLDKRAIDIPGGGKTGVGGKSYSSFLNYLELPSTTLKQLVDNTDYKQMTWVGGNVVAWVDYRHWDSTTVDSLNGEIYVFNRNSGAETRITSNHSYQEKPFTDGQRVVWIDYENLSKGRLFCATVDGKNSMEIAPGSGGKNNPRIRGDYIAWEDFSNSQSDPNNGDIYLFKLSSRKLTKVCTEPGYQGNPYLSDNFLVWEDYRDKTPADSNANIYGYNLSSGETFQITNTTAYEGHPACTNSKLCYVRKEGDNIELMLESFSNVTGNRAVAAREGGINRISYTRNEKCISWSGLNRSAGAVVEVSFFDLEGSLVHRGMVQVDESGNGSIPFTAHSGIVCMKIHGKTGPVVRLMLP